MTKRSPQLRLSEMININMFFGITLLKIFLKKISYYLVLVNETRTGLLTANIANLDSTLQETRTLYENGFAEKIDGHEEESAEIASAFLKEQKADKEIIENVRALILATKMEHEPQNEMQKIIRDADCSHIGSKSFEELTELLRKEWELTSDKKISET